MGNAHPLKGRWRELRHKAQERWGKLTDEDLDVIDGDRDQLEGRLRDRYGKTREQVQREVHEFCSMCIG